MAKLTQSRKTLRKRRGGGPKSRRATAKSVPTATAEGASPVVASTDVCAICLEGMPSASTTRKTVCNHRFHRKCLNEWCHSRKMTDTEATCPMCKRPIPKDCIAVQPGQNMPDYLLRDIILFEEAFLSLPGPVDQERRRRKKEYLMELQFPKKFSTTEWKQLHSFARARQMAINDADVRQIIARRYGFEPV